MCSCSTDGFTTTKCGRWTIRGTSGRHSIPDTMTDTDPDRDPPFTPAHGQTSSLGAMTVPYLQELYLSFCGIDAFDGQGPRIQKEYKKAGRAPPATVIYPSTYTIDNSNAGREVCYHTSIYFFAVDTHGYIGYVLVGRKHNML